MIAPPPTPTSTKPFLDHPHPIPFAHRGGAGDRPENTMPAFAAAVELGYRYVETDVHVTSDGAVLAFHDDRLDRVTDRSGAVIDLPWSEVGRARVAGLEPIPLLAELLAAWPDLRVNLDPKHDAAVEPLAEVILAAGAVDRVCVGSFSDRRIARLRAMLGPRLCTAMGPRAIARLRAASYGYPHRPIADCAQVPVRQGPFPIVDDRFVATAHRFGVKVHVWTIDEPEEMEDLLELGVDGIMTDRPAVLRSVLEQRAAWLGR
ncbi:MAG: glycerophosphodiester phosphodiesterase [Acidimicrobiales bacterium]|nr:glycerophosphodiester phosphodiesterase [Acidimicrobiales bacterium]